MGQPRRRPGQPHRGHRRHPRVHEPRGQGVPPQRAAGRAGRAAPGLAPRRTQRPRRRQARLGQPVRFRAVLLPQRPSPARAGLGPYFYLPKLEGHLEARLWNDAFNAAQDALGLDRGTIRVTVLIETILGAFEMEEILYELRDHGAALNAGRWDYLFSIIKKYCDRDDLVLPDRNKITMTAPFMSAYTELLVRTCHRRGAHAIGGMAAFIPSRRDEAVNRVALAKVTEDKERESKAGFDGTWVAHPDLVPVARVPFDAVLGDRPNQLDRPAGGRLRHRRRPARLHRSRRRRHRRGPAQRRRRRAALPAGLADRQRRRRDLQPHGGRRHRRDRPLPGLAMDPAGPLHRSAGAGRREGGGRPHPGGGRRRPPTRGGRSPLHERRPRAGVRASS